MLVLVKVGVHDPYSMDSSETFIYSLELHRRREGRRGVEGVWRWRGVDQAKKNRNAESRAAVPTHLHPSPGNAIKGGLGSRGVAVRLQHNIISAKRNCWDKKGKTR